MFVAIDTIMAFVGCSFQLAALAARAAVAVVGVRRALADVSLELISRCWSIQTINVSTFSSHCTLHIPRVCDHHHHHHHHHRRSESGFQYVHYSHTRSSKSHRMPGSLESNRERCRPNGTPRGRVRPGPSTPRTLDKGGLNKAYRCSWMGSFCRAALFI